MANSADDCLHLTYKENNDDGARCTACHRGWAQCLDDLRDRWERAQARLTALEEVIKDQAIRLAQEYGECVGTEVGWEAFLSEKAKALLTPRGEG